MDRSVVDRSAVDRSAVDRYVGAAPTVAGRPGVVPTPNGELGFRVKVRV